MGIFDWLFGRRRQEAAAAWKASLPESPGDEWSRSEAGNRVQRIGDRRITVFERDGGWKFCIAVGDDDDDPYFSERYEMEKQAAYEAKAMVNGWPSRYRSVAETRRDASERGAADYIRTAGQDVAAAAAALRVPPASVTDLRKMERQLEARKKGLALNALRTSADANGMEAAQEARRLIALIDDLSVQLAALIAAAKARPRGKPKPGSPD